MKSSPPPLPPLQFPEHIMLGSTWRYRDNPCPYEEALGGAIKGRFYLRYAARFTLFPTVWLRKWSNAPSIQKPTIQNGCAEVLFLFP